MQENNQLHDAFQHWIILLLKHKGFISYSLCPRRKKIPALIYISNLKVQLFTNLCLDLQLHCSLINPSCSVKPTQVLTHSTEKMHAWWKADQCNQNLLESISRAAGPLHFYALRMVSELADSISVPSLIPTRTLELPLSTLLQQYPFWLRK